MSAMRTILILAACIAAALLPRTAGAQPNIVDFYTYADSLSRTPPMINELTILGQKKLLGRYVTIVGTPEDKSVMIAAVTLKPIKNLAKEHLTEEEKKGAGDMSYIARYRDLVAGMMTLRERGLELSWCQYLADEPALITATLKRTLAEEDVVFSFGGIGATPDDHTRQCAADAAGVVAAQASPAMVVKPRRCRLILPIIQSPDRLQTVARARIAATSTALRLKTST